MLRRRRRSTRASIAIVSSLALGTIVAAAPAARATGPTVNVLAPSTTSAFGGGDAPDPDVVRAGNSYYAYTTGTTWGNHIGILTSSSPASGWHTITGTQFGSSAFPSVDWRLPVAPWMVAGTTLAPGVFNWGGKWVMYYTARKAPSGHWCLSVATASQPQGPFTDRSGSSPWFCQDSWGGAVDPSPLVDAQGNAWLYWKSYDGLDNGTSRAQGANIWAAPLSADGLQMTASPVRVLQQDGPTTIENPQMLFADGSYFLIVSRNPWESPDYADYVATCSGPAGPCTLPQSAPIISLYSTVWGPGGASAFTDASGNWFLAYHGWDAGCTSDACGGHRRLYVASMKLTGSHPSIPIAYTARFDDTLYAALVKAAAWFKVAAGDLPRTGVNALAYIVGVGHGASAPLVPPPANSGPHVISSGWDAAGDQGVVQTVARHYYVTGDQAHFVGAFYMIYIWAALGGH